jgi:hypothetical protein
MSTEKTENPIEQTYAKFRKLTTKQAFELVGSLQKKGVKLDEIYRKYSAICYDVPEEDFDQLVDLEDAEVAFQHITEVLRNFN